MIGCSPSTVQRHKQAMNIEPSTQFKYKLTYKRKLFLLENYAKMNIAQLSKELGWSRFLTQKHLSALIVGSKPKVYTKKAKPKRIKPKKSPVALLGAVSSWGGKIKVKTSKGWVLRKELLYATYYDCLPPKGSCIVSNDDNGCLCFGCLELIDRAGNLNRNRNYKKTSETRQKKRIYKENGINL